ncbi:hypothetical protein CRM22_000721, partial [Opisthorchis felineus]
FVAALCGWNNRGAGRISRLTVETTYRLFPRDVDHRRTEFIGRCLGFRTFNLLAFYGH